MVDTNCLFCKIIDGVIPAEKVYEDENVLAFNDINPQAPTHILIIPKKHISSIGAMDEADCEIVGRLLFAAKKITQERNLEEGSFRAVINNGKLAGQEVFHVHVHLLAGRKLQWPPG